MYTCEYMYALHVGMESFSRQSATKSNLVILTVSDQQHVVNELDPVSYKYHAIGLQLGVTHEKLKEIDRLYTKSKDKLREVIAERLKQAQPLTWPSIVSILIADNIKENDLASRLENKYAQAPGKDASIHHISPSCTSVSPLSNVHVPSDHMTVTLPMQRQPLLLNEASETDRTVANQTVPMASMYTGSTSNPLSHQQLTGISTNPVRELNVFQAPPSRSSPEDVINRHSSELTEVIGNDLPYFSSKFIERGFITRGAAGDIDKKTGVGDRQKGNELLSLAMGNYHISHDKNRWFEDFVAIFSSESAYESLASNMIAECKFGTCPHVPASMPSSSSMSQAPSFPLHMPPAHHLSSGGTCTQDNVPLLQHPVLSSWPVPFHPYQLPQPQNHYLSYYAPYYPQPHTSGPPPHNLPQITEFQAPPPKRHCFQYNPKELVAQFKEYVKTLYRSRKVERDANILKLPTPSLEYINLAIIDRKSKGLKSEYDKITEAMVRHGNVDVIKEKKFPIDINKIAANLPVGDLEKVIVVEGAPGVGKSTFAWEFCRRWERGEIAQQYDLVLLLRLRDARISQAKTLKDLICHSSNDICEAVVKELESSLGVNVLIILEGFDELPDACRTEPSLFLELINGQLLPLATVMVTSRPWATRDLHKQYKHRIFQHIEVLGFTKEQIKSYTASSLSEEEASGLDEYLGKHHQIQLCMYIPLNCAIVVTVYQECLSTGNTLPTTLTELYTTLALTLLYRYLRGTLEYKTLNRVENFRELPTEVYQQFSDLCKLAYSGIATSSDQSKILFTDLPQDFNSLGLMDSVYEFYVTQSSVASHNFLHLTFQEYLAAVHISKMQPAERLEHFDRHNEEGKLLVVLRFLAGLTNLEDMDEFKFIDLLDEPDEYSETDVDCAISYQADWLYEAGRGDLIQSAFDKTEIIDFVGGDSSDFSSLGYCIAESQCQWVLSVGREIREEDVDAMVEEINSSQATCGSIVGLRGKWYDDYCHNEGLSISLRVMNMMFTRLSSVFHLHELAINLPSPSDEITWPDLSLLRILWLEIEGRINYRLDVLLLDLSLGSFTIFSPFESGILAFEDCFAIANTISRATSLTKFRVSLKDIDSVGLEEITEALAANSSLEYLHISQLIIYDPSGSNLIKMFSTNVSLREIRMESCSFSVQALSELAALCREKPYVKEKIIGEIKCDIVGDKDALFVCHHPDIKVDAIFSITDDGAKHVAKLLCPNTSQLNELNICGAAITEVGVRTLADSLHRNLCRLYINDSNAGAKAIAEVLHHNSTLTDLSLSHNNIYDAGAKTLAIALHHNSTLTDLRLSKNRIGDAGAEALAKALYLNSTLQGLLLSHNSIGDSGAVKLAKSLHHNSQLNVLWLHGNDRIEREGTYHFIQSLTVNRFVRVTLSKEKFAKESKDYDTIKNRIDFK